MVTRHRELKCTPHGQGCKVALSSTCAQLAITAIGPGALQNGVYQWNDCHVIVSSPTKTRRDDDLYWRTAGVKCIWIPVQARAKLLVCAKINSVERAGVVMVPLGDALLIDEQQIYGTALYTMPHMVVVITLCAQGDMHPQGAERTWMLVDPCRNAQDAMQRIPYDTVPMVRWRESTKESRGWEQSSEEDSNLEASTREEQANNKSLQLRVPLGRWLAGSTWLQSMWHSFYCYTTHRLYQQSASESHKFYPHQRTHNSRTRQSQFHPEPSDNSMAGKSHFTNK